MSNVDRLAVAAIPPRLSDNTIANRTNRSAPLGGEINAGMGQVGFQNRMKSRFGEVRGDAGKFKRET